jgi:hypothetical protein
MKVAGPSPQSNRCTITWLGVSRPAVSGAGCDKQLSGRASDGSSADMSSVAARSIPYSAPQSRRSFKPSRGIRPRWQRPRPPIASLQSMTASSRRSACRDRRSGLDTSRCVAHSIDCSPTRSPRSSRSRRASSNSSSRSLTRGGRRARLQRRYVHDAALQYRTTARRWRRSWKSCPIDRLRRVGAQHRFSQRQRAAW